MGLLFQAPGMRVPVVSLLCTLFRYQDRLAGLELRHNVVLVIRHDAIERGGERFG
jgi:hypothetical protein